MFQILIRLGLRPDAVVGHSSGELPAMAAAGALATVDAMTTEGALESALGRLASVFRRLENEEKIPKASLIAVGADKARVEAAIRAAGGSSVVAIDNCSRQVVLAGPTPEAETIAESLRAEGVLCETLPFARAYHTPAFEAVMEPLNAFYDNLELLRPNRRIYSCSNASAMPDDPDAIRQLAAGQWTRPVAFRETIEAMHRDGLRVFVDVGARGNLSGYVDDILRNKPAFAIAANLPRRSGTSQLNHLVASLFAQGFSIDPTYLYARRRPTRIDRNAKPANHRQAGGLALGFPEMRLSDKALARLGAPVREEKKSAPPPLEPAANTFINVDNADEIEATMLDHLGVMSDFLKTQGEVLSAFFEANDSAPPAFPAPGPWAGEISDGEPGSWITTKYHLDALTDPVATQHTLGGRRISAIQPERLGLPVLPFFTMVEMAAQVAGLVAPEGPPLASLEHARAHKWVEFDPGSFLDMLGEVDPNDPSLVRVSLRQRQPNGEGEGRLVFEAVARFAENDSNPEPARPLILADPKPSQFTAERLYGEQWLFHGPAMRPLTRIGEVGREGISGTIETRPLTPLVTGENEEAFLTDVVALDGFTQLLGCWGLDMLQGGDVVFPLHMNKLTIYGERPELGSPIDCRIHVLEVEHHRIRVNADLIRPDGRVWMRIDDWEDWRFHWPSRYRDVFRAPDAILLGAPLRLHGVDPNEAGAVWLAPPADMGRPVWRNVLERVQLAPDELVKHLAEGGTETDRARRLWERIAAKEAARRIELGRGGPNQFPADLVVNRGEDGRDRVIEIASSERPQTPIISMASADEVAVALATVNPTARPGVGVEPINDQTHDAELSARLMAARVAAAKAWGVDPDNPKTVEIDSKTGAASVRASARPTLSVQTERRGDFAWAWTLGAEA